MGVKGRFLFIGLLLVSRRETLEQICKLNIPVDKQNLTTQKKRDYLQIYVLGVLSTDWGAFNRGDRSWDTVAFL